mmetsp:Transcript_22158/g.56145  ORF Transcript_22158/g.56145 Transcript_22158/m.56145 type:complete len:212 (+) Transcript_22158:294-929(+)
MQDLRGAQLPGRGGRRDAPAVPHGRLRRSAVHRRAAPPLHARAARGGVRRVLQASPPGRARRLLRVGPGARGHGRGERARGIAGRRRSGCGGGRLLWASLPHAGRARPVPRATALRGRPGDPRARERAAGSTGGRGFGGGRWGRVPRCVRPSKAVRCLSALLPRLLPRRARESLRSTRRRRRGGRRAELVRLRQLVRGRGAAAAALTNNVL